MTFSHAVSPLFSCAIVNAITNYPFFLFFFLFIYSTMVWGIKMYNAKDVLDGEKGAGAGGIKMVRRAGKKRGREM
jgi:hypothetical protein